MSTLTTCPHFIGGEWRASRGASTPVFNPSTGEVIAECSAGTAALVDEAVQAAQAAFPAWRDTPPVERARLFFRYRERIEANFDRICQSVTREHGKTLVSGTCTSRAGRACNSTRGRRS